MQIPQEDDQKLSTSKTQYEWMVWKTDSEKFESHVFGEWAFKNIGVFIAFW